MEYNSFYGGRQGAPFIIAGSFERIDKPENEEDRIRIWKDITDDRPITEEEKIQWAEHVIRISKYGKDEGQTITEQERLDWEKEKCMIPAFKLGDDYQIIKYDEYVIIDTHNKNDEDNGKIFQRGRNYLEEDGDAQYVGQIVGPSGRAPVTHMTTIADVNEKAAIVDQKERIKEEDRYTPTINLVPGAKGTQNNRTFDNDTDSIQWASVSIREPDRSDAEVWVGFKFPYTIIDFYTNKISPYENGRYADTSAAIRHDGGTHPYYEQWELKIPEGIKGTSFEDLAVMVNKGTAQNPNWQTPEANDINQHLVYKQINYDEYETGEISYIDLGPYNMIKSIALDDNGNFLIKYTNQSNYSKQLEWVKGLHVQSDGTIVLEKTTGNTPLTEHDKIQWITDAKGTAGYLQIQYNTDKPDTFIWQGTTNSTGAVIAEEATEPEPVFAEGSPWFIVENVLPYKVKKELKYIEGTGTQWIDSKTAPGAKVCTELKAAFTELSTVKGPSFCGVYLNSSTRYQPLIQSYTNTNPKTPYFGCGTVDSSWPVLLKPADTEPHIVIFNAANKKTYFDGESKSITYPNYSETYDRNIYIFTRNEGSAPSVDKAPARLYYLKFYNNTTNELIRDFIPVLDYNDVPCLYDTVSGELFYNQGTGEFLYEE